MHNFFLTFSKDRQFAQDADRFVRRYNGVQFRSWFRGGRRLLGPVEVLYDQRRGEADGTRFSRSWSRYESDLG